MLGDALCDFTRRAGGGGGGGGEEERREEDAAAAAAAELCCSFAVPSRFLCGLSGSTQP